MQENKKGIPISRVDTRGADREIGARIRQRRRGLGLTQQDLANSAGVSYQQIQKYERGTNRVSASRLYLISTALKTSPLLFFDNLGKTIHLADGEPEKKGMDHAVIDDRVKEALSNLVTALKESTERDIL